MDEMLPAEVAQAVREDEADSGDNDGRSEVDRRPAPGIKSRPTGNRRIERLRRKSLSCACLLGLRGEHHERTLHSPKAVKGGHRGCHEQQRRKCEKRCLPERDILRSMTWQKSIEQARGT